jgi:tRNA threonylcarbamoyladenosine biosynthesis protein TsaB
VVPGAFERSLTRRGGHSAGPESAGEVRKHEYTGRPPLAGTLVHVREISRSGGARLIVLALDTTTLPGSLAVWRDGAAAVRTGDPLRPASERLPGDLLKLLGEDGLVPGDVDVFAVAVGPGSLTGLRVGIATMQGLAFATGKPIAGVSGLEAVATAAGQRTAAAGGTLIGACTNAFRGEVFWAAFRVADEPGRGLPALREEEAPEVLAPATVIERLTSRREAILVSGDGVPLVSGGAPSTILAGVTWLPAEPLAGVIAAIAAERFAHGKAGAPHAIRPLYVRRPDAEVARDRRAQQGAAEPG